MGNASGGRTRSVEVRVERVDEHVRLVLFKAGCDGIGLATGVWGRTV